MSEPAVPFVLSRINIVATVIRRVKNTFSHGCLNPAASLKNNPTLGQFCFAVVGEVGIKRSNSDVAMNA